MRRQPHETSLAIRDTPADKLLTDAAKLIAEVLEADEQYPADSEGQPKNDRGALRARAHALLAGIALRKAVELNTEAWPNLLRVLASVLQDDLTAGVAASVEAPAYGSGKEDRQWMARRLRGVSEKRYSWFCD